MVDIEGIPAEKRWEIAAKSASSMPFVYDVFFRKELGDKFEQIERKIWAEGGKKTKKLAAALRLPAGDAQEVGETFGVVSKILFGPEFISEVVEKTEDRYVGKITRCPFLNRAREMKLDTQSLFRTCQAYCKSSVESLNPRYTYEPEKAMCKGDPYCENVIEMQW